MANCFWFYSILAGWSTWQWVFLNFSQNFWSFDTPNTPGCASAVFAENEIWNRLKQFLPVQCDFKKIIIIITNLKKDRMKIFVRLWWQEAAGFTSCNLRGPHSLLFEFMIICERVDFWNVMPGSQPNISAIKRTRCSFTFVWKRRKNTYEVWLSLFFA